MKKGIEGGQAPPEPLKGGKYGKKEKYEVCRHARTDKRKGHNRNFYSEYMERNFSYYPKW